MTPIAQSLSKEDAQALAAYFAGKPWPKSRGVQRLQDGRGYRHVGE